MEHWGPMRCRGVILVIRQDKEFEIGSSGSCYRSRCCRTFGKVHHPKLESRHTISSRVRQKVERPRSSEMRGRDTKTDVLSFRRHSSCCCRTHGRIRGASGLRQDRRHESHRMAESRLRNLPEAGNDFLQKSFQGHTDAREDNRQDQQPANLTCTKQMPLQTATQLARLFS